MRDGHVNNDERCEAYRTALEKIYTLAMRKWGVEWDLVLAYIGEAQVSEHPTSDRARALKDLTGCAWWLAYQKVREYPLIPVAEIAAAMEANPL